MMLIEEQFKTQIDIGDFELENFCVERIANMILRQKNASTAALYPQWSFDALTTMNANIRKTL